MAEAFGNGKLKIGIVLLEAGPGRLDREIGEGSPLDQKTLGLVQAHAKGWDGAKDYSLFDVDGRPVIQHTIERLLATSGIGQNQCCIAVPDDEINNVFRPVAQATGIELFRGSSNNVAGRLLAAAERFGAERILHVMGQHMFLILVVFYVDDY